MLLALLSTVSGLVQFVQECEGIYGPDDFPGKASLKAAFSNLKGVGSLSVTIFHHMDKDSFILNDIGIPSVCLDESQCKLGQFLLKDTNHNILNQRFIWDKSSNPTIPTNSSDFVAEDSLKIEYNVTKSGYYCLGFLSDADMSSFSVELIAKNPYGYLPGLFYPTLDFFASLSTIYLIFGVAWITLSFKYWQDILPLQNYISGVIAFLMIEMAFNYAFFSNYNVQGVPSNLLLTAVVVLNAGRNSLSFFMLLIVSLGYGVVKPTLGKTMRLCVALGVAHFLFGALYAASVIHTTKASPAVFLFCVVPLSFTMTLFYVWTMTALEQIMEHLTERRQTVKLLMYQRLQYILGFSICLIMGVLVCNFFNLSHSGDPEWIENQWKWRWILLDGALNIIYLVIFIAIVILWRPTENNQRYGLQQLASEDPDDDPESYLRNPDDPVGIKLRTFAHPIDYDDMETADDILQWVEDNVGSDPFDFEQQGNEEDDESNHTL